MHRALVLAQQGRGKTTPNPAVGAVVANNDGTILGEGYHAHCGADHAEVMALKQAGAQARGATLIVTLEPCAHHGRTPPCVDAITVAGIRSVVYAYADPNPHVAGHGAQQLQKHGIPCAHLPTPQVTAFYRAYTHWLATGCPWVTVKLALTLDGKIAYQDRTPYAITGPDMALWTAQQRLQTDAILTTIQTILSDDPQLNARLPNNTTAKPLYLLDSDLRLPPTARILQTGAPITLFHREVHEENMMARQAVLRELDVDCQPCPHSDRGLDLTHVLTTIGKAGCHDLWVEAGAKCFTSLQSEQLINTMHCCVAPKVLGHTGLSAFSHHPWPGEGTYTNWVQVGPDMVCTFDFQSQSSKIPTY